MCSLITLIVPTGKVDAVRSVMARHRRAAEPLDNPSLRKVLREGERQYLTSRQGCDCGTVLAARETPGASEQALVHEAARLRRKGWSEPKISRALEDRRRADARPAASGPDSLDLWDKVLGDLGRELKLPYAGLFVRVYAGEVDTETFDATRRQVAPDAARRDALGAMAEDEATMFPLA